MLTILKIDRYIYPNNNENGNIITVVLTPTATNTASGRTVIDKNINILGWFLTTLLITLSNIFSILQNRLGITSPPMFISIEDNV